MPKPRQKYQDRLNAIEAAKRREQLRHKLIAGRQASPKLPGGQITLAQYEALKEAYMETQNIQESAKRAGMGPLTAQKYIDRGTPEYPSIKEQYRNLVSRVMKERDDKRVRDLTFHKDANRSLFVKAASVLPSIVLKPKGDLMPDGKIAVDENTYAKIGALLRSASNWGADLAIRSGEEAPRSNSGGMHINVNANANAMARTEVTVQRREALQRAKGLMSEFSEIHNVVSGTNAEEQIAGILITAARKRVGVAQEEEGEEEEG